MGFFARNAQEEALAEIARQMSITNAIEALRELHAVRAISEKEYIEKMQQLFRMT